jgi:hypothetical protein
MINNYWFNVSPLMLSMTPFDNDAVGIDTSGALFKQQLNHWQLGVFGDYKFEAS